MVLLRAHTVQQELTATEAIKRSQWTRDGRSEFHSIWTSLISPKAVRKNEQILKKATPKVRYIKNVQGQLLICKTPTVRNYEKI